MSGHPVIVVYPDGSPVAKSDVRGFEESRTRLRSTITEVRSIDLTTSFGVDIGGVPWDRDATDTTTADDGVTVIVDSAGNRFKPSWGGAWATYTPAVTPVSGAITTLGTCVGHYILIGKLCILSIKISITTNGAGAGAISATLPPGLTAKSGIPYCLAGRENNISGKMLQAIIQPTSGDMQIYNYDNTYPGVNGCLIVVSGQFEIA